MTPAARVVPDVPSFAVDNGFWYSIPDHLRPDLSVGSIVRVPLSGRRVRGWVVEMAEARDGSLKDVAGISGSTPVFDRRLLESLTWAAHHYVAPVATLLSRSAPPNLPRSIPPRVAASRLVTSQHPISRVVEKTATGVKTPVNALVANWRGLGWPASLAPVLATGRSILVVAASVSEVRMVSQAAQGVLGASVVTVTGDDDASDTAAWEAAQSPPRLVVGTPKTALWPVEELAMAIVLEEGRRAMKDRQTPTIHVREMMTTRSRIEGFNLVFFGPTPSVELLSAGAEVIRTGGRVWPLVEVVDRSDDAIGSGFLSDRALTAIKGAVAAGRRVFVFTHRRVGLASMRCARCRALRACGRCGSRVGRVDECPRCGGTVGPCLMCGGVEFEEMGTIPERLVAEIERRVGSGVAVTLPGEGPVIVGTERDLAGVNRVALAVAADVDGMLMTPGYRATEEALRRLARLASLVGPGHGMRLMVQTTHPGSSLVTTMRRGDPIPYLESVLVERARDSFPPATELIAVEVRGEVPASATDELNDLGEDVVVMGPRTMDVGQRWLLTGSLGKARLALRPIVGHWRDRGATVRVDVDPIDV